MKKQLSVALFFGIIFSMAGAIHPAFGFTDGACKADEQKLCGDVKMGGGAIHDCMKQHEADLSQACKDNIAQMKQKFEEKKKAMEAACGADIKQFCANVTPGEGREIACLKSYDDKISAGCKAHMPKRMMGKHMHQGMNHQGQGQHQDQDDSNQQGDDNAPPPAGK